MRILIATPIYPPEAGGPAFYAKQVKEAFEQSGHTVTVRTYGKVEQALPMGVRHIYYLLKTLLAYLRADWVLVLDTMSVGFPIAMLQLLFGGTVILRTGGDFLWEHYVERTGEQILFSQFYTQERQFTCKERLVFMLIRFTLCRMRRIIFSTAYQRDVWMTPYHIDQHKVAIVENAYMLTLGVAATPLRTNFLCAVRGDMKWKNTDMLLRAFARAKVERPEIELDLFYDLPRPELLERLAACHAVILVSLGDISPNFVMEALALGKPVILTTENGITDRVRDAVLLVDPLDEEAIARAIVSMADPSVRDEYAARAAAFSFKRTYADVARDLLSYTS